ncbi:MAG TPA: iron-sulfur cluster assembly protein [Prolixibacteraceae bacterium]|mgnify:FL=1|nr:iron-sulfur cluster assembly protein [Prolixibacteraceae bacterium]
MDKRIDLIIANLRDVYDPEIPVNIYDLGLVYNVDVDEKDVAHIIMTLTAPGCPVADVLLEEAKQSALLVEGVKEAEVELVFDPPWDKSMMSEEARLELGFY